MSLHQDWPYENNVEGKVGSTEVQGVCMTMSCHWAKETLRKKGEKLDVLHADKNAMGAMHWNRTKEHAVVDAGGGSFDSRVDAWHQGFFERMNLKGVLHAKGAGTSYDLTSTHGVYILSIYGDGGHTMAFARLPSSSVFFDPNSGQHSCKASVFSSFKKEVRAMISNDPTYANLKGKWYVYKVTRI